MNVSESLEGFSDKKLKRCPNSFSNTFCDCPEGTCGQKQALENSFKPKLDFEQAIGLVDWVQLNYIQYKMRDGLWYHKSDLLKHINEATVFTTNDIIKKYLENIKP